MNIERAKRNVSNVLLILLAVVVMMIFMFPFYVVVVNAFKTPIETAASAISLPSALVWQNFQAAANKIDFTKSLINTLFVTTISVVLIVLCASLSGYAIARNYKKHKYFKVLDRVFLSSIMIPFQVIMIPVYKLFKGVGLLNNLWSMIFMLTGVSVAYATFLYVGFVKSVPVELEEAARIDGCGPVKTFAKIVFPLLKPITATVAALHAMWLWNDFNIALILLQKDEVRTLTVKQFYFFSQYASDYNMAFAAAIMGMIPVLIFFLFMQKNLISGITSGAVKG